MWFGILLDKDSAEVAKNHQILQIRQFKTREDLDILTHLANDRNGWKITTHLICRVTQGEHNDIVVSQKRSERET